MVGWFIRPTQEPRDIKRMINPKGDSMQKTPRSCKHVRALLCDCEKISRRGEAGRGGTSQEMKTRRRNLGVCLTHNDS